MRVSLIMAFCLQVSALIAQDTDQIFTLSGALEAGLNNPFVAKTDSALKKQSAEIKSAWYMMLYRIKKLELLSNYEENLFDVERIADLRYQSGDEDQFTNSSTTGIVAGIKTSASIALNDLEISHQLLKQLTYTPNDFIPADSSLIIYEIDKSYPFGTFSVSDDSLSRYRQFVHDNSIEIQQLELDNLFIKLNYYNEYALNHAMVITRTSEARYKAEDITYIEYLQFLAEALNIRLDYLETLNSYNQKAIQLEYYAY